MLRVRASDRGESVDLFSDAEVLLTVGDVSSNDGVPAFVAPALDEVAYVAEVRWFRAKTFIILFIYWHGMVIFFAWRKQGMSLFYDLT